jgi:hypothetical protein
MAVGLLMAFRFPSLRVLFDLDLPRPVVALAPIGVVAPAFLGLEVGGRVAMWIGGWALRLGGISPQIERLHRR